MSVHVSSAAWNFSRAEGGAFVVMLCLADQANDDGKSWYSVAKIAKRCRQSPRSVHRHLNDLERLGELTRVDRPGHSSEYTVHLCQSVTPDNLSPLTDEVGGSATSGRGGLPRVADRTVRDPSDPSDGARKRGTRLQEDWIPDQHIREQMAQERPDVDLRREHKMFVDYWLSVAGAKGTKLDWNRTWRTWMRRANATPNYSTQKPKVRSIPPFTPSAPPPEAADDPRVYQRWYADEMRKHREAHAS